MEHVQQAVVQFAEASLKTTAFAYRDIQIFDQQVDWDKEIFDSNEYTFVPSCHSQLDLHGWLA